MADQDRALVDMAEKLINWAGTPEMAMQLLDEVLTGAGSSSFDEIMERGRRGGIPADEMVGPLPMIAPGVRGHVVERDNVVFVNIIWSEQEGQGNIGRWLDSLAGKKVICPAVLSAKFAKILAHKGFTYVEASDSWVREP